MKNLEAGLTLKATPAHGSGNPGATCHSIRRLNIPLELDQIKRLQADEITEAEIAEAMKNLQADKTWSWTKSRICGRNEGLP